MKTTKTDILILGGGIGGYEVYRSLAKRLKRNGINKKITLVDQNDYFAFIPLLHEVATGSIGAAHTTLSYPEMFSCTPHRFLQAQVNAIDPEKKEVVTSLGLLSYNTCIIALGNSVNYFGIPGADQFAAPIRTYSHALALQTKIHDALAKADQGPVTINIVGGGFTGVEIAGQIQDLVHKHRRIHTPAFSIQVNIIEGAKSILNTLPTRVQTTISRVLEKYGVRIFTGNKVARVTETDIFLENGVDIPSTLAIWSGGVKNIADSVLPSEYTEKGRVPTTPYLTHPKQTSLYAIGDIALVRGKGDSVVPQLGEAAHREGEYVADHIIAGIQKKNMRPFTFSSKGTLIPIGSQFGAAIIGPFTFFGTAAWWLRRFVYLMFVPGIKNKLHIMVDWALRRTP